MRIGHILDACMTADARHRAEMETSGGTMLAVLKGEMLAPRGLRWSGGTWSGTSRAISYPLMRAMERDRMAELNRTDRDCCPRCGARGDAGCGHARVSGGRLVAL
jgi:hypothetical protein